MTYETDCLQINYELLQPMFLKVIRLKESTEILKLFEQLRGLIKLNKLNESKFPSESEALVFKQEIQKSFYFGLINDLFKANKYNTAGIIYDEFLRSPLPKRPEDQLSGLKIFAR